MEPRFPFVGYHCCKVYCDFVLVDSFIARCLRGNNVNNIFPESKRAVEKRLVNALLCCCRCVRRIGVCRIHLDEKLSVHRLLIKVDTTHPNSSNTPTATQKSVDQAFFNCPLTLWEDIVHVVTTKTAGNKRIDQDKVTVDFATMRQRPNETLADFHHRMSHIFESFEMLGLEQPPAATQAMRFIQGLDSARYATMQTSFANELHNGRDLYPTDLPTAVLKSSRWMVSGRTPQDSFSALAVTKSKKGGKGPGEKEDKHRAKSKKDDKEKSTTKCEFCGRSATACLHASSSRKRRPTQLQRQRKGHKATRHLARAR